MAVRALTEADRELTVDVLADAFGGYPAMRYMLGDQDAKAGAGLNALLGFYADKRLRNGWPVFGVDEADRLVAVMLVSPPQSKPTAITSELQAQLRVRIGEAAYSRMLAFEAASDENEPTGHFHFVGMIGVRHSAQGRGHGRRLLDVVKQLAVDERTEGVALSTEDPNNLPFYERLGFSVIGHMRLEGEPPLDTWGLKWTRKETTEDS